MSTTPTTVELLSAIRDHLAGFKLPEPFTVEVDRQPAPAYEHVCVHLDVKRSLPAVATVLLAWADTITAVTVSVWCPPHGETLHLTVHGQLAEGITIRVYGCVSSTATSLDMSADETRTVSLALLRAWADDAADESADGSAAA